MYSEKKCYGCEKVKPAAEFYKDNSKPSGLSGYCRKCTCAKRKKQWDTDPAYKTRQLATRKAWGQAHAVELKAYLRQWQLNNPDKANEYTAKRRALLTEAYVEDVDRRVVWGRDEGHCRVKLVCEGVFVPFEEMHLDHVHPISKGGKHAYFNVQTACAPCNLTKGAKV